MTADPATEAVLRLTRAAACVRPGRLLGRAVVAELARAVTDVCRLRGRLGTPPAMPTQTEALADLELALRRAKAAQVPWPEVVRLVNGDDDRD